MTKKPKLVVFEGVDGVGKTTLAKLLTKSLQDTENAVYFSFPGREPRTLSNHVYALHHEPDRFNVDTLHPASRQILHVAAHVEAIETRIRPALEEGKCVILDRFWWSTVAYGLAEGVDSEALWQLIKLESRFWGDIRPDILFYLEKPKAIETAPKKLVESYEELIIHPSTTFPVVRITNQDNLANTSGQILQHLRKSRSNEYSKIEKLKSDNGDQSSKAATIFVKLSPAKPTIVYDTYWRFAAERQAIFFRRFRGEPDPWTNDPILQKHKFTNAFRASDRVSQYLIKNIIYSGDQTPNEVGFRILLFKLFNKIETWEMLRKEFDELKTQTFKFERYNAVLSRASSEGKTLYSGAYIMPSGGPGNPGSKHAMHLRLLERLLKENAFERIADLKSMRKGFELLRGYPSFGDFLAYQYITDINYSNITNFSEMEFVIPGPGARDGLKKCFVDFGGLSEADIIRLIADRQEQEFQRLGINFNSLWGRKLQLIDCQNLFCEVDKYSRVKHPEVGGLTGRTRIKQKFSHRPLGRLSYWYPPKWKINDNIEKITNVFDL